jgi:hypothetical protein
MVSKGLLAATDCECVALSFGLRLVDFKSRVAPPDPRVAPPDPRIATRARPGTVGPAQDAFARVGRACPVSNSSADEIAGFLLGPKVAGSRRASMVKEDGDKQQESDISVPLHCLPWPRTQEEGRPCHGKSTRDSHPDRTGSILLERRSGCPWFETRTPHIRRNWRPLPSLLMHGVCGRTLFDPCLSPFRKGAALRGSRTDILACYALRSIRRP